MIQGILSIVGAYVCLRYRSQIVEYTGDFAWAEKHLGQGGTYAVVVLLGVFFFFFGIASITGTTGVLLAPLRSILSGGRVG